MKTFLFILLLFPILTTQKEDDQLSSNISTSANTSSKSVTTGSNSDAPPGWQQYANLKMDDELTDDFEPVAKRKNFWNFSFFSKNDQLSGKSGAVKFGGTFGLHLCTFRPCDCFIGSCFAYCAWNWCFKNQDRLHQRFFLPCDAETLDPWHCPDFEYPCIKFC